jgi:hypothetical protein
MIWVFLRRSTSVRKITKSFVKFLQNCGLILNGKENKEAGKICSEIMIPRKRNKDLLWKVPSKNYGSNFIMEKTKKFWFVNISKYHHREIRIMYLIFLVDIRLGHTTILCNLRETLNNVQQN